ncbi:MAG: DUF1326 domain-containing protein, partial [Gammaproteobacteria bacterium]
SFGSCNCIYACPCQFEALPTHGNCRGFGAMDIDKGHFGDVPLDGLRFAMFYAWPGPIFEGKGELQCIVDERANPAQRQALVKIANGEDSDEGATVYWVFRAMSETVHETLFLPIDYDVNIEARKGRVVIPGVLNATGTPIISPATGNEHRVRIEIPEGIEFESAEIGSATTRGTGAIKLDLHDTYGQFHVFRDSGHGPVRS